MAGNAKQYNELEQATTVNDTDLFAVAQEDSNELKTVTTEQVAERVAEIVSTDQVQELISDLAMGKQVLAQELNNKGADVTASDTLTTMASKIQDFDVVGAMEYVAPRVVRAQMNAVGAPTVNTSSYTWSLPYKRALLCIEPSTKLISVKNIPSGSTAWNTISSITDSDLPTTGYAMISSSKDGSYVVLVTVASNIYSLYTYAISDEGVISKLGPTIVTTTAYSQTSAGGVWISNDGTYVYHYGTNSSGGGNTDVITRYTIATGESKVYTAPMGSSGGKYFMRRHYRFMTDDNTICGIYIQASTISVVIGHIDDANAYITIDPEFYILSSAGYVGYGTCPALVDNLLFIYGTTPERDGTGICYVYDVTDFSLITTIRVARQYFTMNTNYSNFTWYDTYSNVQFIYHEDTQTYDIYSSALGAVTYDVNSKTLRPTYPSTGAVTASGAVFNVSLIFMPPNSNYNAYAGNSLCSYISDDLKLVGNGQSLGAEMGQLSYPSTFAVSMYSPEEYLCLGVLYKRNGQQLRFRVNYFYQDEYEAGAYALKSTEAVLNVSQGEDE